MTAIAICASQHSTVSAFGSNAGVFGLLKMHLTATSAVFYQVASIIHVAVTFKYYITSRINTKLIQKEIVTILKEKQLNVANNSNIKPRKRNGI